MTREEFIRRMHSRLDQWNNEIDELVARKDRLQASAHADFEARMKELHERRDEMKGRLSQVEKASESAWQDMKAGIELAFEAIGQAIDSARSRYK